MQTGNVLQMRQWFPCNSIGVLLFKRKYKFYPSKSL